MIINKTTTHLGPALELWDRLKFIFQKYMSLIMVKHHLYIHSIRILYLREIQILHTLKATGVILLITTISKFVSAHKLLYF